jgi:integrase/recombinase XerD
MICKPYISIWLDNRRAYADNSYPVKVRITYEGKRNYYPTGIHLSEADFTKATSSRPGPALKEIHLRLQEFERQANFVMEKITEELQVEFSIGLFEKYLRINTGDAKDVFKCFERKIEELKSRDQIKTSVGYQTALNALKRFTKIGLLTFPEVDHRFLEAFEMSLLKQKKSLTTVSIYIRCLRTIFNEAVQDKVVSYELYPFGGKKYRVPMPANNKRALQEEDILKIINYKPETNTWEEYARDIWVLSLLCQGMNMKDIANLRYRNLQRDKIVFVREKTKRTRKTHQEPISVYIDQEVLDIIRKWGNPRTSPNDFILPIYSDNVDAFRNLRVVEQNLQMVDKYLKKIGSAIGIDEKLTFYSARHSFATTLKRQGRSVEEIREFLGHSDIRTTERYLSSFGDEHKRNIMTDFVRSMRRMPNTPEVKP